MRSRVPPHARFSGVLIAALVLAVGAAGCGGGGPDAAGRTGTAVARAQASATAVREATATAFASEGPAPTEQEIGLTILDGFNGLSINYTAVSITTFRRPAELLKLLDDCAKSRGQDKPKGDADYWATVLGDCSTVGSALQWLYGETGRSEFLTASRLMRRFHFLKYQEALDAGSNPGDDYWRRVADEVYSVKVQTTPIALTPGAAAAAPTATPAPN